MPERTYLSMDMKVNEIIEYFKDFYSDFDEKKAYTLLKKLNINNYIVNKVSYDVLNIVNYYKDEEEIDAHNLKSNYLKLPQAVCDHNDK